MHTVRSFQFYEDQLCTLTKEVESAGALSNSARRELRDLLEQLPSATYLRDLNSVYLALQSTTAPERRRPRQQQGKPKQQQDQTKRQQTSRAKGVKAS